MWKTRFCIHKEIQSAMAWWWVSSRKLCTCRYNKTSRATNWWATSPPTLQKWGWYRDWSWLSPVICASRLLKICFWLPRSLFISPSQGISSSIVDTPNTLLRPLQFHVSRVQHKVWRREHIWRVEPGQRSRISGAWNLGDGTKNTNRYGTNIITRITE